MLHPDGQYEPTLIPKLVEPILARRGGPGAGVAACRARAARAGGMPLYKYVANRVLTAIENRVLGTQLSEMHTGYRAYSSELLQHGAVPAQLARLLLRLRDADAGGHFGFRIAEVPARTLYFEDASSIGFGPATVYGLKTLLGGRAAGAAPPRVCARASSSP